jgi:signal transduction histidine kinase
LREAQNALRAANAQLADKATHLEAVVQQRTATLRDTIGELEAFSYSIAHDMRAPLRSMQGFSDILLSDYTDRLDADGRRFLERIAASAERMDKLIQDVLNYSGVVRRELPIETVDVEQLLRGIVETYPMLAPGHADVMLEGRLPPVLGNEAMLMQIFSNLMGNAVKFVAPGVKPKIRVSAEVHRPNVRFLVRDNGIGIPADQHEKIFAIFQQVSKNFEGTGIGLAIVKKAVERMGGHVGVRSSPGEGSTFWVEMRMAREEF